MGNVKSSLSNMVIVLVIITLVVGAVLGYVYQVTKEPIALSALAKQNEAIELVMPGFNNNPMDEMLEITTDEGLALKLFPAKKDGESIGVAIETVSGKGYGGNIRIMVGMKPDGTIVNYEILEHKETPGLGTRMADWFKPATEGGSEKT
ncbi:MAG TPA: electron transporter RnfG, partial [Marinilabiliaceae bacterium]|nr:electron transporter RnfG [Marinilabiliaceae bacterium]HBX88493.1 electron transporter RnfG [Marinilabiliaceae bacterium]